MEKLFLDTVNFNFARVMLKLSKVIWEKGGTVIESKYDKVTLIHTRGYSDEIHRLKVMNEEYPNEIIQEKLEALKCAEANEPVFETTFSGVWSHKIAFEYQGVYYSYSQEDNYFFPGTGFKYKSSESGKKYYADEVTDKPFMINELFSNGCSEEAINKAAERLFFTIMTFPWSENYT